MAPTVPIGFTGQRESKKLSQKGLAQMMAKTRKVSKGHSSSGFVPDYRHAVETMGESEGFGSSGRVDTEMTASEDSCVPKRKCISLNVDGYDSFCVPVQVLSLSKMSRAERRDLERRLKMELQQRKKRPPPPGRNVPKMKRGLSGRFESVKQAAPPGTSNSMLMKQCETLLSRLMTHQFGWIFNNPVDVVELRFQITSLLLSIQWTWAQSKVRWLQPIEKKLPVTIDVESLPSRSDAHLEIETADRMPPSKKKKVAPDRSQDKDGAKQKDHDQRGEA
ncbi:Transcription factor GTE8 [Vitis vinifera]|uniref:Transcription factor GTE8 n=1 Tax=Vitis vinifera TaxID=29760 RepID=A0A438EY61_VITVI|nr:Transcription factor GTE8 [Vitis vinifera]